MKQGWNFNAPVDDAINWVFPDNQMGFTVQRSTTVQRGATAPNGQYQKNPVLAENVPKPPPAEMYQKAPKNMPKCYSAYVVSRTCNVTRHTYTTGDILLYTGMVSCS